MAASIVASPAAKVSTIQSNLTNQSIKNTAANTDDDDDDEEWGTDDHDHEHGDRQRKCAHLIKNLIVDNQFKYHLVFFVCESFSWGFS